MSKPWDGLGGYVRTLLRRLGRDAAVAHGLDALRKWQRVEAALAARSPTVPLVNVNLLSLTARRVGNYQFHQFFGPLLDQMWVK